MKEFAGIIPPLIIPFNKEGRINEASLRGFIDFLIERKVGGLFPCGTFGSGPLMSIDERKKCAEIIIDATAGRIPVIMLLPQSHHITIPISRRSSSVIINDFWIVYLFRYSLTITQVAWGMIFRRTSWGVLLIWV
jgi:dihydrodipicolinate synthase/N-acetylneuraminate lyase